MTDRWMCKCVTEKRNNDWMKIGKAEENNERRDIV